ncbi:MAG TPA: carboxylesterase family protein [Caulobacteraceae bacterium]|jgi:triacylglycerol lipase|nr:carboxylesterase family protein [Caulobacteraceae bacterium]
MQRRIGAAAGAASLALAACAGPALAQVPPDIEAKLKAMGRVIAPEATFRLYAPLFGPDLLAGVNATKDIAFGPDPKQKLNVYAPAARGGAPRQVLVFLPGGQGDKQVGGPEGAPFYDNIGAWGARNGLVVVIAQYRSRAGVPWDAGARDLATTLAWVKANIAASGGDPNRVVVWGHSNGSTQLATYLGHPDLQVPGGAGVKGAILMSGGFNILPIRLKSPPAVFVRDPPPAGAAPPAGPPPAAPPPVDPAVMLQRSNLEGLKATTVPILLAAGDLDPEERVEMIQVLDGELTKAGHAPVTAVIPGHTHISEVASVGTTDHTVSDPVLKFVRGVK